MAMRTASPWWISAVFIVGLFSVFLGERAFAHLDTLRYVLTGLGVVLVAVATLVRVIALAKSSGKRRTVERTLLLCQLGGIVALLGYAATTGFGRDLLGLGDLDAKGLDRYTTATTVLWAIVMLASLAPLVMAEVSLGISNRSRLDLARAKDTGFDAAAVDSFRVSAMATSGLTIALAAAFLMVTCNVAKQRNIRKDVSYFKTSSPGEASKNMVRAISDPLRVVLFFPDVNEVKDEVRGYFEALASATGNVTIEDRDRMIDSELAEEYKVKTDGTIVLVRGDKHEELTVSTDMKKARRNDLRTFDSKVQKALMKVIRERRVAYMTAGHGEINDPNSVGPLAARDPRVKTTIIRKILTVLNYQVKELKRDDLMSKVPKDATLVLMLAPNTPLHDDELAALDAYLARGGAMLIALDPQRKGTLGILEGRLGVHFNPVQLADDKRPRRIRGSRADNVLLVAKNFSSQASVTTLSRHGSTEGLPLVLAGSLEDAPFTTEGETKPKRTYVIRSSKTTFLDNDKNFVFTKDVDKRGQFNLAAAIEDPSAVPTEPPAPGEDGSTPKENGMRAMVFADAEVFLDGIQGTVPIAQFMFADAVKWLGGEEHLAGDTVSEKDVRIKHTRSEDVVWFYGSIVGAPLLVLGFGLFSVSWRRRRQRRQS